MDLHDYEAVMVRSAVMGTPWENVAFFLLDGPQYYLKYLRFTFAPDIKAADLLKLEKKVPTMFLMGTNFNLFFNDL